MKKIILAIGLMFGGVAFVNAQQTQQQDTTQTQQSDQYRSDTTSTDDTQTQPQEKTQTDTTTTEKTDMYRTEGEGTVTDSTTSASAATTTDNQTSTGVTQEDQEKEGEKIEVSELPAAVQTKLQSTDYQGWVVVSARKKMWSDPDNAQAPSKEVYVIEAKNGAETKKLKFDKDGNELEHDKDKKDDQK